MARDNLRNRTHLPKDIASYERVASATTGDPLGPGTPDGGLGGAAGVMSFPPHIYPPQEGYTEFFPRTASQTVTGPNTTVILTLPRFTLPTNSVGVIREMNFNVNSLLVTADITFTVLIDGAPRIGYDAIVIFPRAAASVNKSLDPENTFLKLTDGAQIEIQVTVVDGGSYQLGADYRGWHFSKTIADQYGFRV